MTAAALTFTTAAAMPAAVSLFGGTYDTTRTPG